MSPSREGPGFIALEGGDARVELVPTQGGLVRSLECFGTEWLLAGDELTPKAGTHPWKLSGWVECAPSAGGGTVPEWVKGVGGTVLPAGGTARTQAPETSLATDHEGHKCTMRWTGERMPWQLERTILVRPDGAVEARYEAITTGRERMPFLWSAWITLPLRSSTRLKVSDAGRLRVASLHGAAAGEPREAALKWPRLTLDKRLRDLQSPHSVPSKTTLATWVDLATQRNVIQVQDDDARLSVTLAGGVPYLGVMIDRAGMQQARARRALRRSGVPSFSLVPSLGAPDRYSDALGGWQSVSWLVPGEPRRWTMTIRGGAA